MGRAAFIERMAQYSPEELGFLDEVSKDERSIGRHYGRARKGERAKKKQPFVRGRRTSTESVSHIGWDCCRDHCPLGFPDAVYSDLRFSAFPITIFPACSTMQCLSIYIFIVGVSQEAILPKTPHPWPLLYLQANSPMARST
jgi:hypothetical protein